MSTFVQTGEGRIPVKGFAGYEEKGHSVWWATMTFRLKFSMLVSATVTDLVLPGARRKVFGSQIGGIRKKKEMLDYSVKHGIYPK